MFELAHKIPAGLLFPNKICACAGWAPIPEAVLDAIFNLCEKMNPKFLDNVHRHRNSGKEGKGKRKRGFLSSSCHPRVVLTTESHRISHLMATRVHDSLCLATNTFRISSFHVRHASPAHPPRHPPRVLPQTKLVFHQNSL